MEATTLLQPFSGNLLYICCNLFCWLFRQDRVVCSNRTGKVKIKPKRALKDYILNYKPKSSNSFDGINLKHYHKGNSENTKSQKSITFIDE